MSAETQVATAGQLGLVPEIESRFKVARARFESECSKMGQEVLEAVQLAIFSEDLGVQDISWLLESHRSVLGSTPSKIENFIVSVASSPHSSRGYTLSDIPSDAPWGPVIRGIHKALQSMTLALERTSGLNRRVVIDKSGIRIDPDRM